MLCQRREGTLLERTWNMAAADDTPIEDEPTPEEIIIQAIDQILHDGSKSQSRAVGDFPASLATFRGSSG